MQSRLIAIARFLIDILIAPIRALLQMRVVIIRDSLIIFISHISKFNNAIYKWDKSASWWFRVRFLIELKQTIDAVAIGVSRWIFIFVSLHDDESGLEYEWSTTARILTDVAIEDYRIRC